MLTGKGTFPPFHSMYIDPCFSNWGVDHLQVTCFGDGKNSECHYIYILYKRDPFNQENGRDPKYTLHFCPPPHPPKKCNLHFVMETT